MKKTSLIKIVRLGFFEAMVLILINAGMCLAQYSGKYNLVSATGSHNTWLTIVILVLIISMVMMAATSIFITNALKKPLRELQKAAAEVSKGKINVDIKKYANNEIGDVVDQFKAIIQTSREQAELARQMADGNLMVDIKPHCDEDVLGHSLKNLVDVNNRVLVGIKESSMQLTAGANQVADASQALAQGSTQQASAIEQINSSMEEIANEVGHNAKESSDADNLIHDIKAGADKAESIMINLTGAMDEINSSSNNISKIIKVIDDIAFQTNILALNATVEAARAGIHGKGFAVVAEEVRNLAEKSAQAAKETADMIQTSINKVAEGNKMTEEMAVSIKESQEAMEKMVVILDSISTSSSEQATAVSQIKQAITQVSQVVQNNSATSEQCASASEELANQVHAMRNMISRYKLKENVKNVAEYQNANLNTSDYFTEKKDNEQIISLDGDFGKY